MAKVNMRDVATRAGVSVMTVSYALRDHPRIPKATRQRIQQVALELGYSLNPLVSAFISEVRHGRHLKAPPTIAYVNVSPHAKEIWMRSVHRLHYEGARNRVEELGFGFDLVNFEASGLNGKRLKEILVYKDVKGLIIAPMVANDVIEQDWSFLPNVVIGNTMRLQSHPFRHRVETHHYRSMQIGLERLSALGYHRIGLATFEESSVRINDEYLAALEMFHRRITPSRRVSALILQRSRFTSKNVLSWLKRERPDVVFDAGQYVYRAILEEAGVTVPHEIAYATTNWRKARPEDAGLNQHPMEVGAAAVDIIVQQIYANQKGAPLPRAVTAIEGSWVDGASAPPRLST